MSTWVELGRAVYSIGLLACCAAILRALPSALRVVTDLSAALGAFTSALSKATASDELQRKQLAIVVKIAEKLGVNVDP